MKVKKTVLMLNILLWALAAVCVLQLIFALIPSIPVKIQTSLFALCLSVEITDISTLNSLKWYIFICAVPVYALCFFIIRKLIVLFKPVVDGKTPFTFESVKIIRDIGFSFLIYAGVSVVIECVSAKLMLGSFLNSVSDWGIKISLPVLPIAIGAVVLSLGEIFSQGLVLKQDNDSIV